MYYVFGIHIRIKKYSNKFNLITTYMYFNIPAEQNVKIRIRSRFLHKNLLQKYVYSTVILTIQNEYLHIFSAVNI